MYSHESVIVLHDDVFHFRDDVGASKVLILRNCSKVSIAQVDRLTSGSALQAPWQADITAQNLRVKEASSVVNSFIRGELPQAV